MLPGQGELTSMEFPCMKEIQILSSPKPEPPAVLELMRRSPNLRGVFFDISNGYVDERFVSDFMRLVTVRTWPDLERLSLETFETTDAELSNAIGGMRRIMRTKFYEIVTVSLSESQGVEHGMLQRLD
ncbi:hypothetical protein BGZ65_007873 [Modicella reniformis]|uniref:Uncharacterized protein n=1 Tax=Modicella reniformis TaxID=1440133 RepID=A0A9P6MAT8_9FUNG|nr:hypothetical protein BGZ65_007873 [Modicella reniformis]